MKKQLILLAVLTTTFLFAEPMDWNKAEKIRNGFRFLRIDSCQDFREASRHVDTVIGIADFTIEIS